MRTTNYNRNKKMLELRTQKHKNDFRIIRSVPEKSFRVLVKHLSKKTQNTFNHFGNINSYTIDTIVKKELTRTDKIKFFSLINNKLIAYSFLTKFDKPTKKHNCILGIVIGDAWQNKGYGKKICQYMIKTAWKNGYEKIWLAVYADNLRGIKLYKRLGFEIEGIFMADEMVESRYRHVISMAIFKEKNFEENERERIRKEIEGKSY